MSFRTSSLRISVACDSPDFSFSELLVSIFSGGSSELLDSAFTMADRPSFSCMMAPIPASPSPESFSLFIALRYSSGLFFQVKALPTMTGLERAADEDCAKVEILGLERPLRSSEFSSLDGRLEWPRKPPPTASLIRPNPDRASFTFPATLLKTFFLSASRSPGLSAMLMADPGAGVE